MKFHKDNRRILISVPMGSGEVKIITTLEDCTLGNHFHKIKTEVFTLLGGVALLTIDGGVFAMHEGKEYRVDPNKMHSFKIQKGSVLYCECSHIFDENDDYR